MKFYPSKRVHELVATLQGFLAVVLLRDNIGDRVHWTVDERYGTYLIKMTLFSSEAAYCYALQVPVSRHVTHTASDVAWQGFKHDLALSAIRQMLVNSKPAEDKNIVYRMTYGVGEEKEV
jgi:hypothetical protein